MRHYLNLFRRTVLILTILFLSIISDHFKQGALAGSLQSAVEDTETATVTDQSANPGFMQEWGKNETALKVIFASMSLALVAFIVIFFRIMHSKQIIASQNVRLSNQQKVLEKTQARLIKAFKQEKQTRERLQKAHEKLKSAQSQLIHAEKMSSLGQVTAGIAHEINNPVGFIKGGVQTLKMTIEELYALIEGYEALDVNDEQLAQKMAEHRENFNDSYVETREIITQLFKDTLFGTERVTEIIGSLRVFSRHDEAKVKLTNLVENLEAALMIMKHKYNDKVEIIRQFDPNVAEIDCFPGQLNQVFVNLISNAIDAMCGTLIISTHDLGDKVQMSFKDNGSGIPESIIDKIFDPFFSTKDVGEGSGLGLAISHSIIDEHRGTIEVFSKTGLGTEFRITLLKKLNLGEDGKEPDSGDHETSAQKALVA